MNVQWNSVKKNPPEFDKRVLIWDEDSLKHQEPPHKCATLISITRTSRGEFYEWQVEDQEAATKSYEWWCDLPDNEPIQ